MVAQRPEWRVRNSLIRKPCGTSALASMIWDIRTACGRTRPCAAQRCVCIYTRLSVPVYACLCCNSTLADAVPGRSTGVFVFGYCIYYFKFKARMTGFMQTAFFFGYMSTVCYGAFLVLGLCGCGCVCMQAQLHVYVCARVCARERTLVRALRRSCVRLLVRVHACITPQQSSPIILHVFVLGLLQEIKTDCGPL